ncbi:MAG: sigma 54-interacting transcriptional regulator [Oscillospiraceae bacterium]
MTDENKLALDVGQYDAEFLCAIYRNALSSIFCSVVIVDRKGRIIYCNPSTTKLLSKLGIDMEEMLRLIWEQIDLVHGSGFYHIESGGVHINASVYPMLVDDERMGSTLVIHESLSDHCKLPEMYHAMSKLENINTFLECSHDGIMVADRDGVMIRVNSAYEHMLGRAKQNLLGRNVREMLDEGLYSESVSLKVFGSKRTEMVVLNVRNRQLAATGTPVFVMPGEISAVVVNLRDVTELNDSIREANHQRLLAEGYIKELRHANERHQVSELVAISKEMQKILDMAYTISDVSSTVLITGESGTGKEVLANQICRISSRRDRPFIKINCAAIPSSLFESELFGYEDGAFTGARKKGKAGFFELANSGTLLLDEICELPMSLQAKLLRTLQDGEVTRIGGSESIKVDVRIIAATNKDIWKMAKQGSFRQDLFYRLNVVNIWIPPLRERRDDIVPLALHLLERCNKKYKKQKTLSPQLAKLLRTLEWPGNARELGNAIENMVVLTQEDVLTTDSLPEHYRNGDVDAEQVTVKGILPLKEAVRLAEQQVIRNAMQRYSTAAEIASALGVDRTTISRKLERFCTEDANLHTGENP